MSRPRLALGAEGESRADYARDERGRLSFVVDVIILLRYIEIDSAARQLRRLAPTASLREL